MPDLADFEFQKDLNDRGESGKRRKSHNVTLQWCLLDKSKTTALIKTVFSLSNFQQTEKMDSDATYVYRPHVKCMLGKIFEEYNKSGNILDLFQTSNKLNGL